MNKRVNQTKVNKSKKPAKQEVVEVVVEPPKPAPAKAKRVPKYTRAQRRAYKAKRALEDANIAAPAKVIAVPKGTAPIDFSNGQASQELRQEVASKGKNQVLKRILMAFALPREVAPVRISALGSAQKSVIASPHCVFTAPWGANNHVLPATDLLIVMTRDPFRALILYDSNDTTQTYDYIAQMSTQQEGTVAEEQVFFENSAVTQQPGIPFCIEAMVSANPYQPHGPVMYPGRSVKDPNQKFIWIDNGAIASFFCVAKNLSGSNSMQISILRWTNMGVETYDTAGSIVTVNDAVDYTFNDPSLPGGGYFAFTGTFTTESVGDSYTVSFHVHGDTSVFGHRIMTQFETEVETMDSLRISGVSMMYTERASELTAQGSIAVAQVNGDVDWTKYASSSGYNALLGLEQSTPFKAKGGCYTFIKPTDQSDLSYQKYSPMKTVNDIQVGCSFDLDSQSPYVVMYIRVEVAGGRDGYITFAQGIEYLSNNPFREYQMPRVRPTTFADALYALDEIPQFHCNPTHFEEIWNSMKTVAKDVFEGALYALPKIKGLLG